MMNALGHAHVHCWNVARLSTASQSTTATPKSPRFIQSCFGSSHVGLIDSNARGWNSLLERNSSPGHQKLPFLEPYAAGETFGVVESQHVLSALSVAVKSEEIDVSVGGDHEQLGLQPRILDSEVVMHDMLDAPAMHLDVDMFVKPLTGTPGLPSSLTSSVPLSLCPLTSAGCETTGTPSPLTSSVPSFLHPLTSSEWKISKTPPPSTSSALLPLHPLTSAEYESIETPLLLQSMMTIDADMELDDDDVVLQDFNVPALLSSS